MIDWSTCAVVEQDSGARVFRGTRVPVAALFENLEDNVPVHDSVAWLPWVTLSRRVRSVSTRRGAP